jgi:hypothetical protein
MTRLRTSDEYWVAIPRRLSMIDGSSDTIICVLLEFFRCSQKPRIALKVYTQIINFAQSELINTNNVRNQKMHVRNE